MVKKREPRHKVSRRFGVDIYGTGGDSLQRRLHIPPGGFKGGRRRRLSEYGMQLFEKQKAKAYYGVHERQFQRYYQQAERMPGNTGHNLLQLIERRLDNVVYRLGFARTRPMARQLVVHGHVRVNGQKVDRPSYQVKPGEVITLTEKALQIPVVIEEMESHRIVPAWLQREGPVGRVVRLPERDEIPEPINEDLIIAFYSRY
ncbi:ribosomal protein S4 [Thermobaculum terrenum ATCC BAA-798]|uniref:Small ribosomal subunit protein uS4 n=1 Tax=Thermobaculum terrenum (strain ATCC BAA-798 / CCMEE 7001 / YNP1) TaxID=525904 RepID=D1CHD9_THET1|nr:30S ribosomal protein S4 [Thermobaculum terrenum]ACZ43160.1 ribosomal protein S4 [Thermobaculum terrenum ATCC BAA-798]